MIFSKLGERIPKAVDFMLIWNKSTRYSYCNFFCP